MTQFFTNGVHLHADICNTGPALLLLHGFTGSSATWTPHTEAWRKFTTVAVDLLGHGRSDCPVDLSRYDMDHCVEDLLTLLDRLGIQRTAVLGYSMGGRIALHLALRAPQRLWALILESASPGIETHAEREARCKSDNALAAALEREGLTAFVDRWEALPLFTSQTRLPDSVRAGLRRQRLNNNPKGLANSLRGLGAGRQEPVLSHLGRVRIPVLLLAGELDAKYCDFAHRMAAVFPDSRVVIMPESGHTIHLEQPTVFVNTVTEFLRTTVEQSHQDGGNNE